MDFDEIKKILELMHLHRLAEFEFEREDLHVRLRMSEVAVDPRRSRSPGTTEDTNWTGATSKLERGTFGSGTAIVKAPILGTFHRSSLPDAPPFVEVGDVVKPGDVLCVIEAMKLMNDIKSEHAGEVMDIFAQSGQPVQYGDRLFAIRRV